MATGDIILTLTLLQYAECQSAQSEIAALRAKLAEAERRITQLTGAMRDQSHEIEQALGAALRYPRYCDSPEAVPGATEAAGVCVGDHVAESLAGEAARVIDRYRAALVEYASVGNWQIRDHDGANCDWIGGGEGPDIAEKALAGATESEAK